MYNSINTLLLTTKGSQEETCSNCSYNLGLFLPSVLALNSAMKASELNY